MTTLVTNDMHISSQNTLALVLKTSSKITLSCVYLTGGLALITLGACTSVYAVQKTIQFYTQPLPEEPYYDHLTFLNPDLPPRGLGTSFQSLCDRTTNQLNLSSGPSICSDLSTKSWKQIYSPESTAAAVGVSIIGNGSILMLSSYAIMAGFSLLGRSFNTFCEAI
ncbi:MAG: hypothetical protein S4CHLAM7_00600 [Chlamydiae bacterium]|nr:hypothetical protein [Chlamydiota bacterium]